MKKVRLEQILQSLEHVPAPKANIEQYPTPAGIAAEVAFIALGRGDVEERTVLDLGCGNGILGIAARLLGASEVVGVDVDSGAVEVAGRNASRVEADVEFRCTDVSEVKETYDTVLMNPPFGSQTKHADLPFLDKALGVASVVYGFHNAVTEEFLLKRIQTQGGRVTDRIRYEFPLSRAFAFHREDVRRIPVVLLRTETAKG